MLKTNKLEYICINKGYSGNNIVKQMDISLNTEKLRYLYVDNKYDSVNITLDISTCYPSKL